MALDRAPATLRAHAAHDRVIFDLRPLSAHADLHRLVGLVAAGLGGVVAGVNHPFHGIVVAGVLATVVWLRWRRQRGVGRYLTLTRDGVTVVDHDVRGVPAGKERRALLRDVAEVRVERHFGGRELVLRHVGGTLRIAAARDEDAEWLAVEVRAAAAAARKGDGDPSHVPRALQLLQASRGP